MGDFEVLCNGYRENKRLIEELEAYNDTIRANIIELMGDNDIMIQGAAKATYKTIVSNKFNTKTFKEEHADIYMMLIVQRQQRRDLQLYNMIV